MSRKLAGLFIAASLLFAGSSVLAQNSQPKKDKKAKKLEFELKDLAGKSHKLSSFKDKIVVLEWIEPGCPYCVRHAKHGTMNKMVAKYGKKNVVFLGILTSRVTDAKGMKAFVSQHKLGYPILVDSTGKVGKMFGAKTTPHMFVVKNGAIAYQGALDDDPRGNKGEKATNYVGNAIDAMLSNKKVGKALTKPYG